MHRALLLASAAMAVACAEGGPSFVLEQRAVGSLDLVYPHTTTNLDGTYSVEASSRMDFDRDGHGTWEIRYVHDESGVVTEEIEVLDLVSYPIASGGWVLVADDTPNMQCERDDAGLRCVDIAGVVSLWSEE